jgi:hypothetical protein
MGTPNSTQVAKIFFQHYASLIVKKYFRNEEYDIVYYVIKYYSFSIQNLVIFVHKEGTEEILAKINNLRGKIKFKITH